jgi:hypothetical protein
MALVKTPKTKCWYIWPSVSVGSASMDKTNDGLKIFLKILPPPTLGAHFNLFYLNKLSRFILFLHVEHVQIFFCVIISKIIHSIVTICRAFALQ